MAQAIIIALIAAISSSGVCSIILYKIQRRDKEKDKESEEEKAKTKLLLGLAHECIMNRGEAYIDRGWVSRQEFEDLNDYLYKPYEALGGDGTAKRVMTQVEALPPRPPVQERRRDA